jgi:hypothetical protein
VRANELDQRANRASAKKDHGPWNVRFVMHDRKPERVDQADGKAYLLASLIDDFEIATSTWAWQLLIATLFVDQRTRAAVAMPSLLCFVSGALIGAPLRHLFSLRMQSAAELLSTTDEGLA